jgi:hypothetical protein
MFTDVTLSVYANTPPIQLHQYLKSKYKKTDQLLTHIPTQKFLSATVASGSFSHVITIDETQFLTLHDPCQATIWRMTHTALVLEQSFTLPQNNFQHCWEAIVVNKRAFIIMSQDIYILDLQLQKLLPPIRINASFKRYSHPNMATTSKHLLINHGPKIGVYSHTGEFQKDIICSEFAKIYTICVVTDDLIAIGGIYRLWFYNLESDTVEYSHTVESHVLSVQYFPELCTLVYGTDQGEIGFFDVRRKAITYKHNSDDEWIMVQRIGRTWVAVIYQGVKVEIYDVETRQKIHEFNEKVEFSVATLRERLVMLTDFELSIWI